MRKVTVKKADLLKTLHENRETHVADFEIAWTAYHEKVTENLERLLNAAKKAPRYKAIELHFNLKAPMNHADDYTRAIEMCEWEIGDQVELTEEEFQQFVQDEWHWKHQFAASNIQYTGAASPSKS